MHTPAHARDGSKKRLWTGRILTVVAVLFLLFDGVTKVMKVPQVVEATAQLGFPESSIPGIGLLLLACTAVFIIPRTAVLGGVFLTGYLGGATAANVRVGRAPFETVFPILFAILIWAGLMLRDERARAIISPRR